MFCKNCGNKLPDTASFCPECGIKVKKEESKTTIENEKVTNVSNVLETRVERNKKSKNNNSTIIIAAVFAVVVIVGLVFIISPWKSHDSYTPTEVVVENDKNEDMLKDSSKSTSKKKSNKSTKSDTKKEEEQTNDGYILKDSDSRVLTESDLSGLTAEQLRLARNEIYARHGRKFNDTTLQSYFDKCSWYHGTIEPDSFSEDLLNDFEKQNKDIITNYEIKMGYR